MAVGVYNGNVLTKTVGTSAQYVNIPPVWHGMTQKMSSHDAWTSDWVGELSDDGAAILIPILPGVLLSFPAIIAMTEGNSTDSINTFLRYNHNTNKFYYTGDGQQYTWSINEGYIRIPCNAHGLTILTIRVVADFPICQLNHPDRLFVSNDQVLTVQENQQQKLISQRCGYTITNATIAFPSNFVPLSVDIYDVVSHTTNTYGVTLNNTGYPAITRCTVDSGAGYVSVSRYTSQYHLHGCRVTPSLLVKQLSDPTYDVGVLAAPVSSTLRVLQTTNNYVLKPLQETAPFSIINDGYQREVTTYNPNISFECNGYFLTPFNCVAADNSNINISYSAQHGLQTEGGFTYTYNGFVATRTSAGALDLYANPVDRNKALFIYTAYQWPRTTSVDNFTAPTGEFQGNITNPTQSILTFPSFSGASDVLATSTGRAYRYSIVYSFMRSTQTTVFATAGYSIQNPGTRITVDINQRSMDYSAFAPFRSDDQATMTVYIYRQNVDGTDGTATSFNFSQNYPFN